MQHFKLHVRNTISRASCWGLISMMACGATPSFAQKYTATLLKNLPGGHSPYAVAINNSGQVTGFAYEPYDAADIADVVVWNGSTPTIIAHNATATDINNLGFVTGSYFETGAGYGKTFVASPGFFNDNLYNSSGNIIDGVGGTIIYGTLTGINDGDKMTGVINFHSSSLAAVWDNPTDTFPSAYLFPPAPYSECDSSADAINNAGDVVGIFFTCSSYLFHAALWQHDGTVKDLGTLGGSTSAANSINALGYIAGWASLPNNAEHAVIWGPTTRAFDLGTLGGSSSYANSINAEGDVVGSAGTSNGDIHAVIWTHKHHQIIDLNNEIDPTLAKEITLESAAGTNDKCQIVVNGTINKNLEDVVYLLSLTDQTNCND